MPVPLFTRQTAIEPLDPEISFAMVGVQTLGLLKNFGPRNWLVFTCIALSSDASGVASVSLRDLEEYTGYNRETIQNSIVELSALTFNGKRVLRKLVSAKFGKNKYILFPDREEAPFTFVDQPARATRPRPQKQKPPIRLTDVSPVSSLPAARPAPRWADEEEESTALSSGESSLLTEQVAGFTSSGSIPLLNIAQVAGDSGYLENPQVAGQYRYTPYRENTDPDFREEEKRENTPYIPTECKPAREEESIPVVEEKQKRKAPERNPNEPKVAADLVALFFLLYGERYQTEEGNPVKPEGNIAALGKKLKALIDNQGMQVAEKMVRYFFDRTHADADGFAKKGHAANWFVFKAGEIAATASGRAAAQIRQNVNDRAVIQVAKLQQEAKDAGETDFLPAHLRALCADDEDTGPAIVWNTEEEAVSIPA